MAEQISTNGVEDEEPDDIFAEYPKDVVQEGLDALVFEIFGSPDAADSSQDTLSGPIDETG